MNEYLKMVDDIMNERTLDEEQYDREVVHWFARGKPLKKAIARANAKYQDQARRIEDAVLDDVKFRYEFLVEHEKITQHLK